MKRVILNTLFFMILLSIIAAPGFCQEPDPFQRRNDVRLFEITELNRMTQAVGWCKNSAGKWVSAENKIPSERDGDGLDNFSILSVSDLLHEGKAYILFTKTYSGTTIQYPRLKMGHKTVYGTHFWIFEKAELEKLRNLPENQTHMVEIPLTCIMWFSDAGRNLGDWLQVHPKDFTRPVRGTFHIISRISRAKNLAHFLVYYKEYNFSDRIWYYGGNQLAYELKTDPVKTFETAYFETTYDAFGALFQIPPAVAPVPVPDPVVVQ